MVTIFYDGLCPVCKTEINLLKKSARQSLVAFVDITDPSFRPAQYGKSIGDFIGTIHGLNEEGELIVGTEVFRVVYRRLGLGWVMGWTGLPIIRPVVDKIYQVFCRIRPYFSKFESCSLPREAEQKKMGENLL